MSQKNIDLFGNNLRNILNGRNIKLNPLNVFLNKYDFNTVNVLTNVGLSKISNNPIEIFFDKNKKINICTFFVENGNLKIIILYKNRVKKKIFLSKYCDDNLDVYKLLLINNKLYFTYIGDKGWVWFRYLNLDTNELSCDCEKILINPLLEENQNVKLYCNDGNIYITAYRQCENVIIKYNTKRDIQEIVYPYLINIDVFYVKNDIVYIISGNKLYEYEKKMVLLKKINVNKPNKIVITSEKIYILDSSSKKIVCYDKMFNKFSTFENDKKIIDFMIVFNKIYLIDDKYVKIISLCLEEKVYQHEINNLNSFFVYRDSNIYCNKGNSIIILENRIKEPEQTKTVIL